MRVKEIIAFVKQQIEPLPAHGPYGERYRVTATLTDGTHLPCVVVESAARMVDLAIRRFDETRIDKSLHRSVDYRAIVKSFVTRGNTINDYDLQSLAISPFAIPLVRWREIGGETSMGWTEFYATMTDGTEFRFGTGYCDEFFQMPTGYVATDIHKIVPAIRHEKPRQDKVYREKPFFTCYIDGI
jgi:hypothetical protein